MPQSTRNSAFNSSALQRVEMAEFKIGEPGAEGLITHSLGACVAVSVFDHERGVGGLLHFMLPTSLIAPHRANERPALFADTGISQMLRILLAAGSQKKELVAKIAGGADLIGARNVMAIGDRNVSAANETLAKLGIQIAKREVGGSQVRSLALHADGKVFVSTRSGEIEL